MKLLKTLVKCDDCGSYMWLLTTPDPDEDQERNICDVCESGYGVGLGRKPRVTRFQFPQIRKSKETKDETKEETKNGA